jgi:PAS domain S-box-containing protein
MARILVVDDNTENRYLMEVLLKGSGYEVSVTGNGKEALDSALADPPDLVISDLLMPVMDGFSLCHAWKSNDQLTEIPFIVYTATYTEQKDEDLALSLGADRFIVKPKDPEVLVEIIREVLLKSRSENEAGGIPTDEPELFKKYSEVVSHKLEQKMAELEEKNRKLERTLADGRRSARHIEHLNRVLHAIRDVNQLIVREKNRPQLIQRACEILVQTRGFYHAWIVLTDRLPEDLESAHAGVSDSTFSEFAALLRAGKLPPCCRGLKTRSAVAHIESITKTCRDCPLTGIHDRAPALIANLAYEQRHYGYLGMSTAGSLKIDKEELSLLEEVAGDLGFGLHAIETEEARRESEQSFRTIFDNVRDGILVSDLQTQRFVSANKAMCRMLGYSFKELKELSVADIHPAETLKDVAAAVQELMQGKNIPLVMDVPVIRRDGVVFYVDISGAAIELHGLPHLLAVFRDVSERRHAKQKLQDANAKLRKTQRRLAKNTRWIKALNSVARDIARRNSLQSVLRVVMRYVEESFTFAIGGIALCYNDDSDLTIAVLGSRGRSLSRGLGLKEGTKLASPESFLPAVDGPSEPVMIAIADTAPGDTTAPTEKQLDRLRRVGFKAMLVVPLSTDTAHVGTLFLLYRQAASLSEPELGFMRGMAEYVSLAVHNRNLYDELENSYKQLQATQQVLMEQERMKAMGQMASGIAHDINNTLAPITLYTEALLAGELGTTEPASRYLTTIQSAVGDIEGITHRLRTFYKHEEAEQVEPIDVGEVVETVVDLTRPRWKNMPNKLGIEITLETQVAPRLAPILGNRTEIREALINLVFNAVDALPKGGTITIRAGKQGKGKEDRRLAIEVSDTGAGMDEEQRRSCLEPFFTTKGAEGSGLGLAVVHGTIQRHQGEIQIDSSPGQGTTVRLLFPLPHKPLIKSTAKSEPNVELPPLRILCVDDNPSVQEVLQEILRQHGHTVESFENGKAAIDAFKAAQREGKEFHVVITDLGMPHMDGKEVARRIKEIAPGVPVILLSGWGSFMNLESDLPPNVDCVLNKPPSMARLLPAIGELIGRTGDAEAKGGD